MVIIQTLCIIALACVCATGPVPNVGYLGSGYDVMKANPHATNPSQGVDPGYQAYVFDLSIYNNTLTPDNKYNVPFGVDILLCDFCSLETDSVIVAGSSSYQESLEREVNGDAGIFKFKFGASSDFKSVTNQTSSYADFFMETKAECCAYKAQISQYVIPPMSAEFTAAIKGLPLAYEQTAYMKLLNYFGTHAVTNMMMGGRFGMRSTFSYNSFSQMVSSTIDRKKSASASLFSFTAAAGTMSETSKKSASTYQRFVTNTNLFMVGGQITSDGSVNSWSQAASANPMPLTITVIPLYELLTTSYFPQMAAADLKSKQDAMNYALNNYCDYMKSQGLVAQCTAPGPDPPMPAGSIWGGFYQADDCNKDNEGNTFTGGLSCPAGFSPHKIGRVTAPESKCGANQYVCLLNGQTNDPLLNYGGAYQIGDLNKGSMLANPLTGKLDCPPGYTATQTGRIKDPESKAGGAVYSCLNMTHTPTFESTGGFFQISDSGSADRIVNPFTQAPSCPPNFCSVQYGRILTPESPVGAAQNVCVACNLINLF